MASPLPAFAHYDFDHDTTFQSGLAAILARTDAADPSARASATTKAKQFYYHKLQQAASQVTASAPAVVDAAASAMTTHKPSASADTNTTPNDEPAYPATFAEIVKLVSEGKPVPGIRDIPDVLNMAPPAVSRMAAPRKPWEQAAS
ncbi:hypothetical protein AMAG_10186 [Allomyces macrogynus ATCC 38327]|uniref:Uncharacterized protein n=1 Tax=Allomyces macrogynus (strain ATCC 38327) TaxID=578462 RepID=A0A0L0SQR9_ALLM3|nr:hypothetical protein AMAG_10186 [Allomyces macrogynus ATCC 38327]|eukprot:KNE64851.1 hypothetical protein AMAG_10186 [Allomyces macrogynus ATCC 38327]